MPGDAAADPADRIRLPWWYLALFVVIELVLLSAPLLTRTMPVVAALSGLPVVAFALLSDRLLARVTGVGGTGRGLRDHPSSRPAGRTLIMVNVVGALMIAALVHTPHATSALAVAAAVTGLAVRCLFHQADGIRRDIRAGRPVPA